MSDVRELLERLADEAPSGDEVLRGFPGTVYGGEPQRPRRRTWLPVMAAAAAGVLVIAGVVWSMSWRDPANVGPEPPVAQQVVTPEGMRLYGTGGVYLAAPDNWGMLKGGCPSRRQTDTVVLAPSPLRNCSDFMPRQTIVSFHELSLSDPESWLSQMGPAIRQNGLTVRRTVRDRGTESGVSALAVEELNVLVHVTSPDAALREEILDSVAAIPEGWTTVPTNTVGTLEEVAARLQAAGLEVDATDVPPDWPRDVRANFVYHPSPGPLLKVGTTVTIRDPSGSCVDTGYCPPPQLNTGQWTPRDGGMEALMTGVLAFDETMNCAYIASSEGGDRYDVLWPKGWSATESADGPQILDESGNVVATAGQQISAPGGSVGPSSTGDLTCSVGTGEVFHVQGEVTVTG